MSATNPEVAKNASVPRGKQEHGASRGALDRLEVTGRSVLLRMLPEQSFGDQ